MLPGAGFAVKVGGICHAGQQKPANNRRQGFGPWAPGTGRPVRARKRARRGRPAMPGRAAPVRPWNTMRTSCARLKRRHGSCSVRFAENAKLARHQGGARVSPPWAAHGVVSSANPALGRPRRLEARRSLGATPLIHGCSVRLAQNVKRARHQEGACVSPPLAAHGVVSQAKPARGRSRRLEARRSLGATLPIQGCSVRFAKNVNRARHQGGACVSPPWAVHGVVSSPNPTRGRFRRLEARRVLLRRWSRISRRMPSWTVSRQRS